MDSSKTHSYILSADWVSPEDSPELLGAAGLLILWTCGVRSWKFQLTPDPDIPDLQGSSHSSVILNGIITTHNDLYMTYTASVRGLGIFSLKLINCHRDPENVMQRWSLIISLVIITIIVLSSCGNNRCWCCCLQEWFAFIITRWKMNIKASVISRGWHYIVTFPMLYVITPPAYIPL